MSTLSRSRAKWLATGRVNSSSSPKRVEIQQKDKTPIWVDEAEWLTHLIARNRRPAAEREGTAQRRAR